MDTRAQLIACIDTGDLLTLNTLLSHPQNRFDVFFAFQHACERNNVSAVREMISSAEHFFFEGEPPRVHGVIRTMNLQPYDMFFELLHGCVVPLNNPEMFALFVPMILNNINTHDRADVLIRLMDEGHTEMADQVMELCDASILPVIFEQGGKKAHTFYTQRSSMLQRQRLLAHVDIPAQDSGQRKI